MKTLVIIRHAKSSWEVAGQDDIERPLNDRGKKDAPEMAKRLKKRKPEIDVFLSSPAKRARKTASCFAEAYGVAKKNIRIASDLYGADIPAFYKVATSLSDQYGTVALFSHNPGITDFVNSLGTVQIDNMPTCGVFAITAATDKWADLNECEKSFLFFDYPKKTEL